MTDPEARLTAALTTATGSTEATGWPNGELAEAVIRIAKVAAKEAERE